MKYVTITNSLIALVVVLLIGGFIFFSSTNTPLENKETEQVAATTQENTNSTQEILEETPTEIQINSGLVATQVSSQGSVETQQIQIENKELGPREPATVSPVAALELSVEAMQSGDLERSLSYFSNDVRDAYRTAFTTEYKDTLHPVFVAYLSGTTDPVELIQPEYGLYEVMVYPAGSELGYSVNMVYDSSTAEFVITEL